MANAGTVELDAQYRQLREECGLLDRSARGKLLVSGPDAAEYLQGQLTNDIEALAPGEGCYAALLDRKGHIQADMRVLHPSAVPFLAIATKRNSGGVGGGFWIDTEPEALEAARRHLDTYRIGREVELADLTAEGAILSLIGPRAAEIAGTAALREHASQATSVAGVECLAVGTAEGIDLIVGGAGSSGAPDVDPADSEAGRVAAVTSAGGAADARPAGGAADARPAGGAADARPAGREALAGVGRLREAVVAAGAPEVSAEAAEVLRIEAGRPRFGAEMGPQTMPAEAGIVATAVDFEKGCYIGQEPVARLHYRGRPNRQLRGLRLSAPAAPGAALRLGEREAGRLGSACLSPAHGPIGLAVVRREAEPGAELAVGEDGVTARVVELPFAWNAGPIE
jgi:folate-binding protein YgfZ